MDPNKADPNGKISGKGTREIGRRTVLKNVAIASGIFGATSLTGQVAARIKETDQSMQEAGVADEVDSLIESGEVEEAVQLLEEANVNYSATRRVFSFGSDSDDGDLQVTPDDDISRDSTIYLIAGEYNHPIYRTVLHLDLEGTGDLLDCTGPDDGVGISYSDDRWRFDPRSEDLGPNMDHFDPNPEGCIAKYNDYAFIAGFDDPTHLRIDVEKLEAGQHNLYGHYAHTWIPCTPLGGSVSFGISVGALQVTPSGQTDYWKEPSNTVQI